MYVAEPRHNLFELLNAAIVGGVNIIQWRDKRISSANATQLLVRVRKHADDRTLFSVNTSGATDDNGTRHNLQIPQSDFARIASAKAENRLIGASVHSLSTAKIAQHSGADYLVAGSVFPTSSHPNCSPMGTDMLGTICCAVDIPVLAIGGITWEKVQECVSAGASGVAVRSAISLSNNPLSVVQQLRHALDNC